MLLGTQTGDVFSSADVEAALAKWELKVQELEEAAVAAQEAEAEEPQWED